MSLVEPLDELCVARVQISHRHSLFWLGKVRRPLSRLGPFAGRLGIAGCLTEAPGFAFRGQRVLTFRQRVCLAVELPKLRTLRSVLDCFRSLSGGVLVRPPATRCVLRNPAALGLAPLL